MFSIIAKLLSSVASFLFPVFASYKALKSSDPAQLTPWLMYWVVLAIALLVESWFEPILVWVPFYSWMRLGFLLYLILPTTQGAKVLYQQHVDPFLHQHELEIDDFISNAHDHAKEAAQQYFYHAVDLLKQYLLGIAPQPPPPPPPPTTRTYAQSLLARFSMPAAGPAPGSGSSGATASDFYNLLASAVSAATSSSMVPQGGSSREHDLSNSGMLIPPNLKENEERMTWIAAQRERLSILLSALDREASTLSAEGDERPTSRMSGLSKSRSEDFEKIDSDIEHEEHATAPRSGGWMPWSWGTSTSSASDATITAATHGHDDLHMAGSKRGRSSGVDI